MTFPITNTSHFHRIQFSVLMSILGQFHHLSKSLLKSQTYSFNLFQCIVHCENGGNKSISVVIAYLMKYKNLTLNEGLSYINKKLKQVKLSYYLD